MSQSPSEETIANLVMGVAFMAVGWLNLIHTPNRDRARLARKFSLPPEDLDRLFHVIHGPVSRAFDNWQGAAAVLAGLSRLAALLPGQQARGICLFVLLFCVLNMLIVGGLSMVFTARAQYYSRRVTWHFFWWQKHGPDGFTGQDSWWAAFNILWLRVLGVIFLSVIAGLLYVAAKSIMHKI